MNTLHVNSSSPLSHCWGPGNRLLVIPRHSSVKRAADYFMHEVMWGVSMGSNEFMRRLAKTSFGIYASLQRNSDSERHVSFSMQYRAALAACSQEILHFIKLHDDMDEAKAVHLTAQCELIQRLELVWHLAELVFIQALPAGHLAYNLCSWFYVQSQEAADDARCLFEQSNRTTGNSLDACPCTEDDERFWPAVLTLVLQARPHEAACLLTLHSQANSRGLRGLRQLLVAMPIASHSHMKGPWAESGADFSQAWHYWQSECLRRFSSGEFEHVGGAGSKSAAYVQLILSVLSGNPNAWNDSRLILATGDTQTWYFRFVSYVFYTDQLVTVGGLSTQLNSWLQRKTKQESGPNADTLTAVVDNLITSVFHLDLQSFVRAASEGFDNWWFVAHFTNLLHLAYPGVLFVTGSEEHSVLGKIGADGGLATSPPSLPDFFLTGYAESLATDRSLLSLALGYLDFVPQSSSRQAALLLVHGFPVSTRATNWFISQACRRGLHDSAEQLARVAARRILPLALREASSNTSGPTFYPSCAAMGWAFSARDHRIVNRLAEHTLANDQGFASAESSALPTAVAELAAVVLASCQEDRPSSEHRVDRVPGDRPKLLLSPELAFLIRYAELQQCFTEENTEGAVDRLIDLLVAGSSSAAQLDDVSGGFGGSYISSRLRLRLLSEIRHLLGRNGMRRDQVELLISALVDLRVELSQTECSSGADQNLSTSVSQLHILLARELASTYLLSNPSPVSPSLA